MSIPTDKHKDLKLEIIFMDQKLGNLKTSKVKSASFFIESDMHDLNED